MKTSSREALFPIVFVVVDQDHGQRGRQSPASVTERIQPEADQLSSINRVIADRCVASTVYHDEQSAASDDERRPLGFLSSFSHASSTLGVPKCAKVRSTSPNTCAFSPCNDSQLAPTSSRLAVKLHAMHSIQRYCEEYAGVAGRMAVLKHLGIHKGFEYTGSGRSPQRGSIPSVLVVPISAFGRD